MKSMGTAILVLATALLSAGNVALANPELSDGDGPVCATGPGSECKIQSSTKCTKYTIVELKIGLETVIVRQCAEETSYTKHYYWTP